MKSTKKEIKKFYFFFDSKYFSATCCFHSVLLVRCKHYDLFSNFMILTSSLRTLPNDFWIDFSKVFHNHYHAIVCNSQDKKYPNKLFDNLLDRLQGLIIR